MGSLDRKRKAEGEIGYFGLWEWWQSSFSAEERSYVEVAFAPLGRLPGGGSLTQGRILTTDQTAAAFLSSLAGWFKKRPEDRDLAQRILAKAEERAIRDADVLGLHSTYQEMIQLHYRWRNEFADALDAAVAACEKQIAMAAQAAGAFRKQYRAEPLPSHVGYKQLAIILEKQSDFRRAIQVSRRAEAEGWAGDWPKRISRLQKKLDASAQSTRKGTSTPGNDL